MNHRTRFVFAITKTVYFKSFIKETLFVIELQ